MARTQKTVRISISVPVTLTLVVQPDDDDAPESWEVVSVQRVDPPGPRAVMEAMTEDDLAELDRQASK